MRFQVILPTYNASRWFEAALASVSGHPEGEVLVIDDGSDEIERDRIEEISKRYLGVRFIPQDHRGLVGTLNYGLSIATAPYVARMDADDISLHGRFDKQLAYLDQYPDVAVLGGNIISITEDGSLIGKTSKVLTSSDAIARSLSNGKNPIMHPTVMMRRDAVEAIGGYRPATEYSEDFDLWLRLSEQSKLANLDAPLLKYRRHKTQITQTKKIQKMFSRDLAIISSRCRRQNLKDPIQDYRHPLNWCVQSELDDVELIQHCNAYRLLWSEGNQPTPDIIKTKYIFDALKSNLMGQSSRAHATVLAKLCRIGWRQKSALLFTKSCFLGLKRNPIIFFRQLVSIRS